MLLLLLLCIQPKTHVDTSVAANKHDQFTTIVHPSRVRPQREVSRNDSYGSSSHTSSSALLMVLCSPEYQRQLGAHTAEATRTYTSWIPESSSCRSGGRCSSRRPAERKSSRCWCSSGSTKEAHDQRRNCAADGGPMAQQDTTTKATHRGIVEDINGNRGIAGGCGAQRSTMIFE